MKLAFSTLGCPDYSWSDIYAMAKDIGFGGIELRGLGDDIFSVHAEPFSKENIKKTIKRKAEKTAFGNPVSVFRLCTPI